MGSSVKEIRVDGQIVFEGSFLQVNRDRFKGPDGKVRSREYITHPGAAVIIPILKDKKGLSMVMIQQYRYAHRRLYWELPAGKKDPHEKPLTAAKRELLEETGYVAKKIRKVSETHPCIGYSNEVIDVFLAEDLEFHGAHLDEGEFLKVQNVPVKKVFEWFAAGKIPDGKTQAALLWYLSRNRL